MTPEIALQQISEIVDRINFLNVGQLEAQIKQIVSETVRQPYDPASLKIDQIAGALMQPINIFSAGAILTQIKAVLLGGVAAPPPSYHPHGQWGHNQWGHHGR